MYRHNYLAEYIDAHTYGHSSSHAIKALIVSLFFCLCCFSPSCTLLPALSTLPFISNEASELHRQREQRRRKEGAATRGNEKREEMRRSIETESRPPYLRWHTHTQAHRGHCLVVLLRGPVITQTESDERVAPLSSSLISSRLVSWWRNGSRGNRKSYSDFFWGSYHDSLRCQGSEYWLAYWPGRGSKKAGEVQVQDFFVKLNAGHLETDVWKQRNTPRIWKKGRTAVLWI